MNRKAAGKAPRGAKAAAKGAAAKRVKSAGVSFDTVREIFLALPGVEEGKSYGTPAFRVKKKFLSRIHDNGEWLVVRFDMDDREILMRADPEAFFITDHYRDYPAMLIRLSAVKLGALRDLIEEVWRREAPSSLVDAYDEKR